MKTTKTVLLLVAILALLAIPVSCQYMLWDECRSDHSFWYCVRVLSK